MPTPARIIGHEAMMKRLAMPPAETPLPQNVRMQDANGNGRIESSEAQGTSRPSSRCTMRTVTAC
jgi:hypothetical protein